MKRRLKVKLSIALLGCGVVFAVGAVEQLMKSRPELPVLLPDGALLSIEARDFAGLLKDWNSSEEKRVWLTSVNHTVFSTDSRLYSRLSSAQQEFSAAAGLPTDSSLLDKVAGKESCLGLYDIGNLEFVYITRLDQQEIENTPLWQTRGKFEQRTEAGTSFYVHKDEQSSRMAAFAQRDGWLILGTREDLVAGVLDRLAGTASHNLATEGWFAEAVKQTKGERGDLRMVLNLAKIVRTPYFRSYWVQQNVTEMKQYASAVSDLYRTKDNYREERILVRREAETPSPQGDVQSLLALAPDDAAFYAAQASPGSEQVLQSLRDNLLDLRAQRQSTRFVNAPLVAISGNAGSATQLDVRIDQAPSTVKQADAYAPLRALLLAQPPVASLEVFSTRAPRDGVFVSLQTAMVLSASRDWDKSEVCAALTSALVPGLTAGKLGANWEQQATSDKRSSFAVLYLALDGAIPLYLSVSGKQLLLANDSRLLEQMLERHRKSGSPDSKASVTYAALFRHTQEKNNYRLMMAQLDLAVHRGSGEQQTDTANGQRPAFFSGDVQSLSGVFSKVESEHVEERDLGTKVTQTVTYQWRHN